MSPLDRLPRAAMLARAAIAGATAYVAIDVALVFLRPRFSVLHNAESDYGSRGSYAWLMDANFVLRGLLGLAVVCALWQTVAPDGRLRLGLRALALWSVASGLLALFPDDPVGTHTHGAAKVHALLAVVAFLAVVAGTIVTARALRPVSGWAAAARALEVVAYVAIVPLLLLGRVHLRPRSLGGLYEKLFLGSELAWFVLAAAALLSIAGASSGADL